MSECNVTFLLNKMSSDNLLIEEHVHRSIWKCCRRSDILTTEMLNQLLADILRYCLTHRMDSYKIHLDRMKGVALIRKISKRSNYSDMGITQIVALLWACLSVVHHFHIRVVPLDGFRAWFRRRQYLAAMMVYERVLMMLLPQLFTTVIKSLITFFNEAKIWDMESYVTSCIRKILLICKDSEGVINHLLDIVEVAEGTEEARNILRVVRNLFMNIQWKEIDDYMMFRFLEMYRRSTMNEEFEGLKYGIESCLRYGFAGMPRIEIVKAMQVMIAWVFAINPGFPIEFGNLLEYGAGINNNEPYAQSLPLKFIYSVLELVASSDKTFALLGCRIMFFILDRQKNTNDLLTPKLFYADSDVDTKVGKYDATDKTFVQGFNLVLHNNLMTALVKHGNLRMCTEAIFSIMAAIVVEIPCPFTAAMAVSFGMAAQEYVLSTPEALDSHGYKIHACVVFLMTLVCHVHKAKIFYDYVNSVMTFRAIVAPQLNPPICNSYEVHPLQIARAELYFEDWEARYGLYRCFIKTVDELEDKEREQYMRAIRGSKTPVNRPTSSIKQVESQTEELASQPGASISISPSGHL